MKLRNFSLLLTFCLLLTQFGMAQQLTVNENGEQIIVYPDGSWKYATDTDKDPGNQVTEAMVGEQEETDKNLEIAIEIAELAAAEEAAAFRKEEDAKYNRILIEEELNEAEDSEDYFADEIKEIKDRLKAAKKAEKKAKTARKSAAKKAREASKLVSMDAEDRAKELQKHDLYETLKNQDVAFETAPMNQFPAEESMSYNPDL